MNPSIEPNENARVSHLPRFDGVQNPPNNFDLNPVTLTFVTLTLTLVTLTFDHLFGNYAENWNFDIFELGDLDLQTCPRHDRPWCVCQNFRSIGPMVQPVEHKKTDRHTDGTENITSSANAGMKEGGQLKFFYAKTFPIFFIFSVPTRTQTKGCR